MAVYDLGAPARRARLQKVSPGEAKIRSDIAALEAALHGLTPAEFPLTHTFTDGVYCREIFIPKGSVIVGKIHRHDHLNFMSRGDVTVLTKDGLKRIVGPCTMVSSAGTKRALYAHEDTVWTTIHANPTNETDLVKLEKYIISPSYEALEFDEPQLVGYFLDKTA